MEIKLPPDAPELSPPAQRILLRVAREAITAALRGELYGPPPGLPEALRRPAAAFVSLHIAGALRGCIGVVRPLQALAEAVAHCARSAALEDPRFPPLTEQELERAQIEISVLGDMRPLAPAELPRPGLDGVAVDRAGRQGLLLPQVATEQGWDGQRLLEETCLKAGLEADEWARGARVRVFQARVFSEGDPT